MDDSSLPPNVIRLFRSPATNSNAQKHKQRGPERRQFSRRRPEQDNRQGPGERQLPDRRRDVGRRH